MKDIGIRELKTNASSLIRHVAENREPYTITRRGKSVAILSPFRTPAVPSPGDEEAWARFVHLAARLEKAKETRSPVDDLHKTRR